MLHNVRYQRMRTRGSTGFLRRSHFTTTLKEFISNPIPLLYVKYYLIGYSHLGFYTVCRKLACDSIIRKRTSRSVSIYIMITTRQSGRQHCRPTSLTYFRELLFHFGSFFCVIFSVFCLFLKNKKYRKRDKLNIEKFLSM